MAKIKVYETTREVTENAKNLMSKMNLLKNDVDTHINLVTETRKNIEKEAHELEERKKLEASVLEKKKRDDEQKRADIERLEKVRRENVHPKAQSESPSVSKHDNEQIKPADMESKPGIQGTSKNQQNVQEDGLRTSDAGQSQQARQGYNAPKNTGSDYANRRTANDGRQQQGIRPQGDATQQRPQAGRPQGVAGQQQRPQTGRPQGDTGQQRPYTARPQGDTGQQRPQGGRPQGDAGQQRPYTGRPQGDAGSQRSQAGRPNNSGRPSYDGKPQAPGRSQNDGRPQRGAGERRPNDIVDKFLAQPPVVSDKEKPEVSKNTNPKGFSDQTKDKNRKNKKDYWEDTNPNNLMRNRRNKLKGKQGKGQQALATPPPERKKAITMGDIITVKELSERIGIQVAAIIKKLLNLGILATINKELDYDTANIIASEFNIELERKAVKTFEEILVDEDIVDEADKLEERPPVITVMGHVDHGKTSLLDAIRNANVTEHEAGGITQHIGAYTITINNKAITFLDTPGHEAFTSMRARGAQVTDAAILVVAADDGVMPQTIEAINHAKAANVPIIVAINKMDKIGANPDRVKQELTQYGLVVEEWGGDTIAVPVSAINREGIDTLLEMILLIAEVQEFKANPDRLAKGTIIEAQLDKGRGPVATILVQNGTLKVGDSIVAGTTYGRVRAMMDDKGRRIKQAGPSTPVEVLGLSDVPEAGDVMYSVEDDKLAKQVSEERKDKVKELQIHTTSKTSLDELYSQIQEGEVKDLNLILKADVQGSVEAVKQALEKLTNEQVRVRSIHGGVGAITESDVMLAAASNAIIIGFNVRPSLNATELADREGIDIRLYRVIYNAIEDIESAMKGLLDPEFKEVVLGHAKVRATFKVSNVGTIAGCYVTDGKITRNAEVRVVRDGIVVHEGKIDSLKRFKDDAKDVASGYECGIGLENFNDIKEEDVIEAFIQEEIKR